MTTQKKKRAIARTVQYLESLKEEGQKIIEVDWNALREAGAAMRERQQAPPPAPAAKQRPAPQAPRPRAAATGDERKELAEIAKRVSTCTLCSLCETRNKTVPGQGHPQPEIMFIGEGPGADEDAQGLAFVGRAGQLLTKIIEAMGMTREEVFIGNIVKCRPPGNRVPTPDEMEQCIPYLIEQIAVIKPKVIVCLGSTATKGLFGQDTPGITKVRGQWRSYEGIDVMPTFHPAYLLRGSGKREAWEDMKTVLRHLGKPIPKNPKKQ